MQIFLLISIVLLSIVTVVVAFFYLWDERKLKSASIKPGAINEIDIDVKRLRVKIKKLGNSLVLILFPLAALIFLYLNSTKDSNASKDNPDTSAITGEIHDETGNLIKNAWAKIEYGSLQTKTVFTGSDGKFYIPTDSIQKLEGSILFFGKDSVYDQKTLRSSEYLILELSMHTKTENIAPKKTYKINGFVSAKFKAKIKNLLSASYSEESPNVFYFSYDKAKLISLPNNLYRYDFNGKVSLYFNSNFCSIIDNSIIPASNALGASKSEIEDYISRQMLLILEKNTKEIAKHIEDCLN